MISRLPPTTCTHFIGEKPPSKVKFQSTLERVGVDLELRSKKLPSILFNLRKKVGGQKKSGISYFQAPIFGKILFLRKRGVSKVQWENFAILFRKRVVSRVQVKISKKNKVQRKK